MNHSPTINRSRLEQYPLFMHPLVRVVACVSEFVFWGSLLLLFSYVSPTKQVVTPLSDVPQSPLGMVLDLPWLGIILGLIVGISVRYPYRLYYRKGIDTFVSWYFCGEAMYGLDQRSDVDPKFPRVMSIFPIFALLGFAFFVSWVNEFLVGIFVGYAVGYVCMAFSQYATLHREILRRRCIALAWKGVDRPDNRITFGQKLKLGLVVGPAAFFSLAIGYMTYIVVDPSLQEYERGHYLFMEGRSLGLPEVAELDRMLAESPDNVEVRMMLIGYHERQAQNFQDEDDQDAAEAHEGIVRANVLYLVEHVPGSALTEHALNALPWETDDRQYLAFTDLWRGQVERYPSDPDVYWNAAWYFAKKDDDYCRLLIQRGRELEPKDDSRWDFLEYLFFDGPNRWTESVLRMIP